MCVCVNFTGRNQQKLGEDGDYNMDENEAESETDKQVALTADDRTLPGNDWVRGSAFNPLCDPSLSNSLCSEYR